MYRPLVTLCLLEYGLRHIPIVCICKQKKTDTIVSVFFL